MINLQRKTDIWLQLREKWKTKITWADFNKMLSCLAEQSPQVLDCVLSEQRSRKKAKCTAKS